MTGFQPDTPETPVPDRLQRILNDACLALMISVGHRTGLFDAMAGMEPAPVDAIADAAGLEPRYVREWLGAMVTGEVVEYDPDRETYRLPDAWAAHLTREAGADNQAFRLQFVPILAGVEDRLVECFRDGGGVPYEAYERFHEALHEGTAVEMEAHLVDTYLPLALDVIERLDGGARVLDVGCGAGHPVNVMARAFPRSSFTGIDISEEAVEIARAEARARGLDNAAFEVADAAALGDDGRSWDVVTAFDAIHDQAAPARVLEGIRRSLRPDGRFFMLEPGASSRLEENLDHPTGPYLYTISCMHCMSVSLAAGGPGLGAAWGRQRARRYLEEAGFTDIRVRAVPDDPTTEVWVAGAG